MVDFKKHLETAWHLTIQSIVPLVIMTLAMIGMSIITLGIMAPVTLAGYTRSVLLLMREQRTPKPQDIFLEMRLFLPLLGFCVLYMLAALIGLMLLVIPGFIIIVGGALVCLYMIPLMVDKQLGLWDAVRRSYALSFTGRIADNIVVFIIFFAIVVIGGSSFIGSLLTQPFATIFLLSVYREKVGDTPVGGTV